MKRKLVLVFTIGLISIACILPGAATPMAEPTTAPPAAPTAVSIATKQPVIVENVNIDEGLLAYYPLDGDALEDSGRGSAGELANINLATDRFGLDGGALLFNGIDSVVVIPDDDRLELTGDFSISFLIQGNSGSTHEWLIMTKHMAGQCQPANTSWMLRYDASNGLRLLNYDTSVECGKTVLSAPEVSLLDDQWHHLVLVHQAATLSLYMDGSMITSVDASVLNIQNNGQALVIGNQTNGIPAHNLDGAFDELRFYDRAIGEDVIQALFNATP